MSIFGFRRPATPPDPFADLVTTLDQAELIDTSLWSIQNNDAAFSFSGGKAIGTGANGSARFVALNLPSQPAGKRLTSVSYFSATSGNVSLAPQNVTDTDSGAKTAAGRYMNSMTVAADGVVQLRHVVNAGVAAELESCHVFDLDAMLAKPWAITLIVSQSNYVGNTCVLDPAIDIPAYGCVAFPGGGNPSRGWALDGSGFGIPGLVNDPVMHSLLNGGGGPLGAYMRETRTFVPQEHTPVALAAGYNGAGFAGNGAWSSGSSPRPAYDNFWTQARHVWSIAPPGSYILAVILCQGESDLGAGQMADWNSPVDGCVALLNEIRAEPGWGEMPIVISEIGCDPVALPTVQAMIDNQKKLATGSGDALEFSRCVYNPRPEDAVLDVDNIHFVQATQRVRGFRDARAVHDLVYQL